jgi:hypothetical protein
MPPGNNEYERISPFGRQLQMINPIIDSPVQGDAIMALQSQTSQFVAIDRVLTHEKLRADELMLHEARWDDMYFEYDTEHEQKAFTHAALQWRFYKGGKYVHALSLTRLSIQRGLQNKIYSHFSEGIHEHSFFVDQRRKPLPYLQPEQQDFLRCYRMLYISPQFSFDAARKT